MSIDMKKVIGVGTVVALGAAGALATVITRKFKETSEDMEASDNLDRVIQESKDALENDEE